MASVDHTVLNASGTDERLAAEAARCCGSVDDVATELLGERLPAPADGGQGTQRPLQSLAAIRARVGGQSDAAALVSEGRAELAERIHPA
jgi:hypothetical protein